MSAAPPTLVLTGGQVLTVDGDFTVTEGVAVCGPTSSPPALTPPCASGRTPPRADASR
ncbi:hypothetical protein AB0I98_33955 [Streptomyces sp. NPDC050211]|uniref:hypothetical protein n=1 Tax=Streptomyces sp. NPDC050211 TaxID=3154932 RepID=UPI0034325DDC